MSLLSQPAFHKQKMLWADAVHVQCQFYNQVCAILHQIRSYRRWPFLFNQTKIFKSCEVTVLFWYKGLSMAIMTTLQKLELLRESSYIRRPIISTSYPQAELRSSGLYPSHSNKMAAPISKLFHTLASSAEITNKSLARQDVGCEESTPSESCKMITY